MKRLLFIISLFLLVGCSSNNVPEGFVEEDLKQKAETVVQLLNANQLDQVYIMFRPDIQAMVTLEDLDKIITDKQALIGAFKEISQIAITDTKDPNTSELYAVVIIVSEHEDGKSTYTVSFNKSLEIVGFYIK
jgi:hypothetical protein